MITIYPNTAQIGIEFTHQQTHEGRFFSGSYYNSAVASPGAIDVLIQTGSKSPHLHFECSSVGDATILVYEDATFSSAGTEIRMSNHNRKSANTFVGTVTHGPTITGIGNQVNGTGFVAGGTKNQATGGAFGYANEFILKTNSVYLVRMNNDSGSTTKMAISIQGYIPEL